MPEFVDGPVGLLVPGGVSQNGHTVKFDDTVSLVEAMQGKELVEITDNAVVLADRAGLYREIGTSGRTVWGSYLREDYNAELRGQLGIRRWDEMKRNDAQCRATLRLVKVPVVSARWYLDPASDKKRDKTIAEFVWYNLTKNMTVSWPQLLWEKLLHLDYGFYVFEKVFERKDGQIWWRKMAPRHPVDLYEWEYDLHGGPNAAWYYGPREMDGSVRIPIEKLLVYTNEKEGGNLEGVSVLRSAYKHWYFKENLYKIDAIQKERHGIGIPIITLPPNFSENDKKLANEMGSNLRTNEKAHVVLPPNWTLMFAKLEGQPVNALESAEHHDLMIARNILGQFINRESGESGEQAQQEMFLKATRYIADQIRDVINKWAIPELVNLNWANVDEYPELKVRRIGESVDWQKISFAVRNMIGAGVIRPDDALETWAREELDFPRADPSTRREIATPQLPRQSTAAGKRTDSGNSNVGSDDSGDAERG